MGEFLKITVDDASARRVFTTTLRRVQKPSRLMKLASGEVARIFRENFRQLDKSRSRYGHAFYIREGSDVTTSEVSSDGNSAAVVVASVAMAHKLRGGTVRPKNAKFLAIPVSGWAKSQKRNPGSIPGLDLFVLKSGRRALARENASGGFDGIDYILVRSVTHRPHPEVIPQAEDVNRAVINACRWYERRIGGEGI